MFYQPVLNVIVFFCVTLDKKYSMSRSTLKSQFESRGFSNREYMTFNLIHTVNKDQC